MWMHWFCKEWLPKKTCAKIQSLFSLFCFKPTRNPSVRLFFSLSSTLSVNSLILSLPYRLCLLVSSLMNGVSADVQCKEINWFDSAAALCASQAWRFVSHWIGDRTKRKKKIRANWKTNKSSGVTGSLTDRETEFEFQIFISHFVIYSLCRKTQAAVFQTLFDFLLFMH